MTLSITNPGSNAVLKTDLDGGEHIAHHRDTDRATLLAAVGLISNALANKATDAGLVAIANALGQTLAVSAANLPLPVGAATQTKQDTGNTSLATLVTKLADPATQTTLAAILAKMIAAPSTEAKQDTGNTSLATLVTKLADPATQTTLAAILAKMIAAPATEAKQDTSTAAVNLVGTRAYGTPLARLAVGAASAYSAVIAATEVMLHASTRCFVGAIGPTGTPTLTSDYIPLEAGEKFHLRLSGQRIGVIRDTTDGFLNIIPVA